MTPAIREQIRRRAGNCCEYCQLPQSATPAATFHVEHIIASQHSGETTLENLALACDRCNLHKGTNLAAIDAQTRALVRLFNPRNQRWSDHFQQVGFRIEGLTDVGRATANLLQMNAIGRVQLREELGLQLEPPT